MNRRVIVAAMLCGMTILLPDPAPATDSASLATAISSSQIERYRAALDVDPNNLPLHYFLGVTLLLEGRDQEAIKEFRRAYPAFVDSIEANFNLGIALTRTGDHDSALLYLDRAEELGALKAPNLYPLTDAYFNLALAASDNQAPQEAERLFQKVLALDPQRIEVHRLLGDLHARQQRTEQALEHFTAYLEHVPDDPSTRAYVFALYMNQGTAMLEQGDQAGARQSFTEARPLEPDSPLPDYYLGYLDYARGQHETAVDQLKQAYPRAGSDIRQSIQAMLYNSALAMLQQRKSRLALGALAPLTGKSAADAKALALAGRIHLTLEEYQAANRLLSLALQLDPTLGSASANLVAAAEGAYRQLLEQGQSLLEQDLSLEARQSFEQALTLRPEDARARSGLEQAEQRLKSQAQSWFSQSRQALQAEQPRKALEFARKAMDLTPDSPEGARLEQRALARLNDDLTRALDESLQLLAQNHLAAAQEALGRARALSPGDPRVGQALNELQSRRHQLAEELLAQAEQAKIRHNYNEARSLLQQALVYRADHAGAQSALAKLDEQFEARVADLLQKGRNARDSGRFSEARTHFNQALALQDTAETRQLLESLEQALKARLDSLLSAAHRAAEKGDFRQAETLYAKVLALEPDNASALKQKRTLHERAERSLRQQLARADKLLEAGNLKDALAAYRSILDDAPDNRAARTGLQRGHQQMRRRLNELLEQGQKALADGHMEQAKAPLQQLLAMDPYHPQALETMERLSRLQKSGIRPGDEQRLYLKGIEFYTQGRYEEAISEWEQVLTLQPAHDKARMNIDKARRKLKQIREFGNG